MRPPHAAIQQGQRKDADPDVREHFPSPWKEHLIPGSLARFSAHMSREHSVLTPALVQKLWCHMLRFLPVWGNRNTVLTKHWVEVLVRAAEHGKRSDDDLISQVRACVCVRACVRVCEYDRVCRQGHFTWCWS
jgi:hypothetical protein